MITGIEQEYYERVPYALDTLAREIKSLREAVEKCIGKPIQDEHPQDEEQQEEPAKEEHPKDSVFDVLVVTNVQVFPFKDGVNMGHFKGLATIVLNDQMQIRGLRVMEGENGLYVGYPNDPFYKGEDLRSVCFPITRQLREHIENCVLEKYQASIE